MTETRERRIAIGHLEQRASDDGRISMRGYAYRFNELSHDLGGFRERIVPGAGGPSLRQHDVYATFNHDTQSLLGRTSSGTLRVGEDREGGWYEIDLPDTTVGRDVAELLKRGDLKGSSFTFRVLDGGQRRADDDDPETGLPVREITAMDVVELGPVVNPAYPTTQASLRSIEAALHIGEFAPPDAEGEERDSQSAAFAPASHLDARALVRALSK
ncbi:HK97 family phage prohead protease [Streptomyces sp. DHE17-7]|uniref:HK97 family phage prohead protease n=1 Tax=Streptomyces sp. DHE17-7 TaxID=2759949 RepID=UPI0022EA62D0|nr:HK97 family phage prohead protease [Streptomyces sp. DHE17-7]MBJ6623597.1 HK97 family phage prohead protease [Streptomyces sp. DHE17-7]